MIWVPRLSLAHLQYANTFFVGLFSLSFFAYVIGLKRHEIIRKRERRNMIIFQTLSVATGLLAAYLNTKSSGSNSQPLLPTTTRKPKSVFEKDKKRHTYRREGRK